MAEITKTKLTAGVFILLAIVGTTYYVGLEDNAYFCEDTNLVGLCWKLSNVNDLGFQTRCYYNESAPTRYKNCKTGWIEFIGDEFVGIPINYSEIDVDFNFEMDKVEALKSIGIGTFEIRNSSCKTWNYSETYNCINWDLIETQYCISWDNETNSTCLEDEILQVQGDCLEYETIFHKENCLVIDQSILDYDKPKISSCIKIDNSSCKAKIFQKNGINKELTIFYENLSRAEIENKLIEEANKLFDKIADVQIERNKLKEDIFLTGEISLNI